MVLALLVIRNGYIVDLLHRFLPNVSFFIIVILLTLVMIGMFLPADYKGLEEGLFGFMVLVSLGLTFWALGADQLNFKAPYWLENLFYNMTPFGWISTFVIIFVMFIIFKKTDVNNEDPLTKLTKFISAGFKKR